jgi:phytoene/squalene synthetase
MNTSYNIFPYKYPISTAKDICKERYKGFKFISKIPKFIFPKKDIYTMCYAYFRWFDNIVDSSKQSKNDINYLIKKQKQFLSQLYSDNSPEETFTEELFLAHLVLYDKKYNKGIKKDIENLIDTFEFDTNRKNKLINSSSLDEYIEKNTKPYVNITHAIFNVKNIQKEKFYSIAKSGFIIDYLSDLKEDLEFGYINIPVEDIKSYNINIKKLNDSNFNKWIKDKLLSLEDTFQDEKIYESLPFLTKTIIKSIIKKEIKNSKN